jgi:5-methylcytosine-specific restriction protein A
VGLDDVTAVGVNRAIEEYDRLGQVAFLQHYGFHPARTYFLVHDGREYDSEAIVGAAHGYDQPTLGPLKASAFSGGEKTVATRLRQLGFVVRAHERPPRNPPWAEEELTLVLDLYLREGLLDDADPRVIELSLSAPE